MTCEEDDRPAPARIRWAIELYEPFSRVWMCRGLGHAVTSADPADIARAVLAGYLAASPPAGYGETFRAVVRADGGEPVTVTADQLPDGAWQADPAVREALPEYLRGAPAGG